MPDLILYRQASPDIPQPAEFSDTSEKWGPTLPGYRRQYPLIVIYSAETPISPPGQSPAGYSETEEITPEYFKIGVQRDPPFFPRWAAGGEIDPREGTDLYLRGGIPGFGLLGGRLFIPFMENGPRPWSGEINWERIGAFSTDTRVGVKKGSDIKAYGSGRFDWETGIDRPDSYYLAIHEFGLSDPGLSVIGGTDLELYFENSSWLFITEIDGGGWYSSAGYGAVGRAALAAGYRFPTARLTLKAGFDGGYNSNGIFSAAPYFGVLWRPKPDLSLFIDTGLETGYPAAVDDTFSREYIDGFVPELPIYSRYRLGLSREGAGSFDYKLEFSYGYGLFAYGFNSSVITSFDRRLFGSAAIGHSTEARRIEVSGAWDYSILGSPFLWKARMEFSWLSLSTYLTGGSDDAILGSDLPGIRGEVPILGIGLDWIISDNWIAGTFFYAAMPWARPSLKLAIDWRR